MKANVKPRMAPLFQAHDPARHADFGCKTCHGPEWKKPREFLPTLTIKDGKLAAPPEKSALVKFMVETVTPQMAQVLGKPPYDPATGTGFGCIGCHVMEMK